MVLPLRAGEFGSNLPIFTTYSLGFHFYKKMLQQTNIENVNKAMKLNGLESKTEFDMANMNDTEMRKTCNKLRGKDWAVVKIRIGDENSDLIKRDLRFTFEDKIAAFGMNVSEY